MQGRKRAWKCNKIQYFALAFLLPCTATLLQVATLAKTKATQLHLKKKTKNMLTNQLNIFKIQPTTSKEHNLILIVLTSMKSIMLMTSELCRNRIWGRNLKENYSFTMKELWQQHPPTTLGFSVTCTQHQKVASAVPLVWHKIFVDTLWSNKNQH